ncbi:MAG TPA: LysM peptidoglycan-binding domain-containing protein [Ureibacillus sp.]|nr:LysM peptidoglycan-binding domain-containing protein [Ureibacillus sp.]
MLKKFLIVPVAALTLSVGVGANAQAAMITVQKGDTLWNLARTNNTSVEAIQTVNQLSTDLIHPGDVLAIATEKYHTVKLGDTLWDIALNHNVSVAQLKEWNQLHTDLIHPGLNLLIYTDFNKDAISVAHKAAKPAVEKSKAETTAPVKNNEVKEKQKAAAPAKNNTPAKSSTPKETAPAANNPAPKESAPEATTPAAAEETVKETAPETTAPEVSGTVSAETTVEENASTENNEDLNVLTMQATAYTASCEGCTGITATGINLLENPDAKVISVDPTVIPLGSKVYVEGYGEAIAGDTGGGIKGHKIDVFIPSKEDAINFGVKQLKVTILD